MEASQFESDQFIMHAIREYLGKHNYLDTLRTLDKESKLLSTLNNENLIRLFETGEKDLFFSAWKPLVLPSDDCFVTELHLNIYFYLYHLNTEEKETYLDDLKVFLQKNNEFISQREDLFPYLALPLVSNPASHPNFQHLFSQKFKIELEKNIFLFIKSPNTQPTILESLFKTGLSIQSPKSGRIFRKIPSSPKFSNFIQEPTFSPSVEKPSMVSLNYTSICSDLFQLNSETAICALLQALRWKITQSDEELSVEYLSCYIKNNVLCTTKPHDKLLDRLLSSSKKVQEYTVKLLNIISFKKAGRDYILTKDSIISMILRILYSEKTKSSLVVNSLSLLQKLSLNKSGQVQMISQNMIKWLIKVMRKEVSAVDEEMIEFCAGILMNLSVRSIAKEKFEEVHSEIIPIVMKYLNYRNERVVNYTFCLLYTLMGYKTFRETAKKSGIEKVLKGLRKNYKGNEIDAIFEQISSEADNDISLVSEIEAEEMKIVDDDLDDLIEDPKVLKGNELLRSKYEKRNFFAESVKEEVFLSKDKIPRTPFN